MENTSGLEPTEYNVLVKPDKVEEKTKTGIYVPDMVREKEQAAAQRGVIVAMSPLAFTYETWPAGAYAPRVGDLVAYGGDLVEADPGEDRQEHQLEHHHRADLG